MIAVDVEPFDHQRGGDWPGDRGVKITTDRPHASGRVLSASFPTVYLSDARFVDIDDQCFPVDDFIAWLDETRKVILARLVELGHAELLAQSNRPAHIDSISAPGAETVPVAGQ